MPDVIRFGMVYCPQNVAAVPVIRDIIAETRQRRFRTMGAALPYVTRRLRVGGLSVRTLCDVRARGQQVATSYGSGGGGTAA